MAWALLVLAGLLEIGFAIGMKKSAGFTQLAPTVLFVVCATTSMVILNFAIKSLPMGTAYAAWTGIGAAGTAVLGILLLGEDSGALRVAALALIVGGVVLLRVADGG